MQMHAIVVRGVEFRGTRRAEAGGTCLEKLEASTASCIKLRHGPYPNILGESLGMMVLVALLHRLWSRLFRDCLDIREWNIAIS